MVNMLKCLETLLTVKEATNDMNYFEFSSMFCMLAEEYCKEHDLDVCEFMSNVMLLVQTVNVECGKY